MPNYRIHGEFATLSPLSHIGETISTTTYLVEEPILQPSGEIEPVFVYNGNAFRGQCRDLAATYMLEKLGCAVSLEAFHLLFSGGRIGGDQSVDIEQARMMRRAVPKWWASSVVAWVIRLCPASCASVALTRFAARPCPHCRRRCTRKR